METSTPLFQIRSVDLIAVALETRDHMVDHPSQCIGGLNIPERYLRSFACAKFVGTSYTGDRDPLEVAE
jgi:hypothetical protein